MTTPISNYFNQTSTIDPNVSATGQVDPSMSLEDLEMVQMASDEFTSSISNVSNALSDINTQLSKDCSEATKEELLVQKQELIERKQDLETKRDAAKSKMSQIQSELATHRSELQTSKSELSKLRADSAKLQKATQSENKVLEAKNKSLNTVSANLQSTKSELDAAVEDLNDSVDDITKQSADELNKQRKAISGATSQAMLLVQAGEIKPEDMPSYIAGKIAGFNSVGNTNAGAGIINSKNSKIKALCGQVSNYVVEQGNLKLAINASTSKLSSISPLMEQLNTQIKAKSTEVKASQSLVDSKNQEYALANSEYVGYDAEIAGIDNEVASLDALIAAKETGTTTQPAQNDATQLTAETNTGSGLINGFKQLFGANNNAYASTGIDVEEEMRKISAQVEQILSQEVVNTEIDDLRSKISEADKAMVTMRQELTDNAQKMIDERLDATKRS